MKKNNLLYVLMSFLSFTLLFGSIYFIVVDDIFLGAILAVVSLFSIVAIFFLLRKNNSPNINTQLRSLEEIHYKKSKEEKPDKTVIKIQNSMFSGVKDAEFTVLEENFDDYIEASKSSSLPQEEAFIETAKNTLTSPQEDDEIFDEIEETTEEKKAALKKEKTTNNSYEFKLIVNPNFEDNITQFISKMIDEDMFLESYHYRYTAEQVIEHNLVGENLYKYEFHPIPFISLHPDKNNDRIIKIKVGLSENEMIDMGYVPQINIEDVNNLLSEIKSIKAYLTGGTYNVLEKNSRILGNYKDPFFIKIKLYQQ